MPFLDHLEELRSRLIKCLVILLIGMAVGLVGVWYFDLIGVIGRPLLGVLQELNSEAAPGFEGAQELVFLNPAGGFLFSLKLGFIAGIILASPFVGWQAWLFLAPALHENERKFAVPSVMAGTILFLSGVAMAYFVVLPLGLEILVDIHPDRMGYLPVAGEYLDFATRLTLAFGLIFELPLVIVFLTLLGVVTPETLSKYRRHAIVGMAIVSAMLTPADAYTMLAMMVPMMVLYEISVLVCKGLVRRRSVNPDAESGAG